MRSICLRCLRLFEPHRVTHTTSCPHCGGALATH